MGLLDALRQRLRGTPAAKVEPAKSGRSKCRLCDRRIAAGTLRMGVDKAGPHGPTTLWYHLACAARFESSRLGRAQVPDEHRDEVAEARRALAWPAPVEPARGRTGWPEWVEARAAAGDWVGVRDALLAWWRSAPCPELADAVDAIEAGLPQPVAKSAEAALEAIEAAGSAGDVGAVIRLIPHLKISDSVIWLRGFREQPPDPRWTSAIAAWIKQPPTVASVPFWRGAFALLRATGDARGLSALEAADPHSLQTWEVREVLQECIPQARKALAKARRRPLKPGAAAAVARAVAAAQGVAADAKPPVHPVEDALWAAVYADPEDLAARAVLADALLERQEPRGELITLQLLDPPDRAQRARIKALIKAHRGELLGPLQSVVLVDGLHFSGGFVERCAVRAKSPGHVESALGAREWATVRDLDIRATSRGGSGHRAIGLAFDPALKGLRVLRGVEASKELARICFGEGTSPVETLHCIRGWGPTRWNPVEVSGALRLPALSTLHAPPEAREAVAELLAAGLHLRRLVVEDSELEWVNWQRPPALDAAGVEAWWETARGRVEQLAFAADSGPIEVDLRAGVVEGPRRLVAGLRARLREG